MNTALLLPCRKRPARPPITQRLIRWTKQTRKQIADFIDYLKRGHPPKTAWRMARNVL